MREVYNRWMEANGGEIVNIIADIWHGWPEFGPGAKRPSVAAEDDNACGQSIMEPRKISDQLVGHRGRHGVERIRPIKREDFNAVPLFDGDRGEFVHVVRSQEASFAAATTGCHGAAQMATTGRFVPMLKPPVLSRRVAKRLRNRIRHIII